MHARIYIQRTRYKSKRDNDDDTDFKPLQVLGGTLKSVSKYFSVYEEHLDEKEVDDFSRALTFLLLRSVASTLHFNDSRGSTGSALKINMLPYRISLTIRKLVSGERLPAFLEFTPRLKQLTFLRITTYLCTSAPLNLPWLLRP